MATGLGHDAYLQIGREATWGTTVSATRRFNIVSGTMNGERVAARCGSHVSSKIQKNPPFRQSQPTVASIMS